MADHSSTEHYRRWYAKLLCLYPEPFRSRFREEMEQTFTDALRGRAETQSGLLALSLWMFIETFTQIIKGNIEMVLARNKHIIRPALATGLLLLAALIAQIFSAQMNWGVFDFVFMGALLFGAGLAFELMARRVGLTSYRAAAGIAVIGTALLVWGNVALGVIGSEDNPANAMYMGVILIECLGVGMARFRPQGMARALFATAFAQGLVAVIALIGRFGSPEIDPAEILALNGFFAALFAVSAILFRYAGLDRIKAQPTS